MSGDCIGPRHRVLLAAMIPYIERGERVDYEAIAAKLDLKPGSVKSMISQLLRYQKIFRAGFSHDRLFSLRPGARPTKQTKETVEADRAERKVARQAQLPEERPPGPDQFQSSTFITPPSKERLMGRRA